MDLRFEKHRKKGTVIDEHNFPIRKDENQGTDSTQTLISYGEQPQRTVMTSHLFSFIL